MGSAQLIWLVLLIPLFGALFQALVGGYWLKQYGLAKTKRFMGFMAVASIALSFAIGAVLAMQMIGLPPGERESVVTLPLSWIRLIGFQIPFEVIIDPLSITMVLIITGVGALIHLYATGYMAEEREFTRFFTYLNLFVAAMLILVLGNNLALMFIGWEGVGLCSYLLIGFWYKDVANAKAANKAFIVNRIGDWGLTLGMFLLVTFMLAHPQHLTTVAGDPRWMSYDVFLPNMQTLLKDHQDIATAIALLFFVGACGKSAQFPLYFWLPDAMAGPTPVSALIHAATMVTSGVVMLNRLHIIFEISSVASAVVVAVGAFTALFAAMIAFGQTDIKKVLAYSTVSQLGFMFIGCGAGGYWSGMFHVTTHAFFKALLFLGSGAVIYAMAHNQDMRNYGRLAKYLPITYWTMIVGYVAIAAFSIPGVGLGFAGYYSKEAILGYALANDHAMYDSMNIGMYAGYLGLFVAALTACYMTRMTWLTFLGKEERWRSIPAVEHHDDHDGAHGHDDLAPAHANLAHHSSHDHGEDVHGFFYTDEEMAAREEAHEHHHELDQNHTPKEVPATMWIPLVALAILSIVGGWYLERSEMFEKWLYPNGLPILGELEKHPHNFSLGWASAIAAYLGLIVGWLVYRNGLPKSEGWDLTKWAPWRKAAANQFGYDAALMDAGTAGGGELATATWKYVDVGIIDRIVNGLGLTARGVGSFFRAFQTGYVRSYALMMLFGTAGLLGYFVYLMTKQGGPR